MVSHGQHEESAMVQSTSHSNPFCHRNINSRKQQRKKESNRRVLMSIIQSGLALPVSCLRMHAPHSHPLLMDTHSKIQSRTPNCKEETTLFDIRSFFLLSLSLALIYFVIVFVCMLPSSHFPSPCVYFGCSFVSGIRGQLCSLDRLCEKKSLREGRVREVFVV